MNMQASASRLVERSTPIPELSICGAAFDRYVEDLESLQSLPASQIPVLAAAALERLLEQQWKLPRMFCEPGEHTYQRHVLYADPADRFTVLSLVWRPGQATPVHGHTAWGVVGVYAGEPGVENYRLNDDGIASSGKLSCQPGDVCYVQPGTEHPHRVFNDSSDVAVTLHTYGRNLVTDPASINIVLDQP